ncbi:hypothetical protein GCM10009854_49580 [Saccharopolyspora halophila]|uniref:eCIS core domain-containing protein n=1 Tax=Saccharopolyspora halophila TaxID=405551 RepID=A0ABN3GY40_9PSEU
MSGPVPEHQQRSSQDNQRRKRKNRAPKNRTPEPKEIVSGAGQPLDLSTRRELEERLGHDFSRVRVHTDRDAGQLTDALGADAVAVGQDILFGPGKFRPGTTEGNHLLAHELLHTVQNPTGLGALRAGRDLGEVSLPQQAIEQEAESGSHDETAEVQPGRSSPGWLRYATVDADRTRAESLDPATLVDRMANGIIRSLRGDPEDRSKRTRRQLAHMSEEMREAVLDRLDSRLLSSEQERVLDLTEEVEHGDDLDNGALSAPEVEPDAEADMQLERETEHREAADRNQRENEPEQASAPEKEQTADTGAAGSTPENVEPSERAASNEPAADEERSTATVSAGQEAPSAGPQPAETEQSGESAAEDKSAQRADSEESGASPNSGSGEESEEQSSGGGDEKQGGAQHEKSGAGAEESGGETDGGKRSSKGEQQREGDEQESESQNRRGAAAPPDRERTKQDEQRDDRTGSPNEAGEHTPQADPISALDGTRNQDAEGPQEKPASPPAGGDSEVEVGGGEESAWDIKLKPEDFLPKQDLDVSGVPTADELEAGTPAPSMPSFPAPPPTKADQVHAEREAEDAEDAAEAQEADKQDDSGPPLESTPSIETETSPRPGDLSDLATEKAADPGTTRSGDPGGPKTADDPEQGPVEAQRAAQEAPGKPEGGKDEKGGAAKESAAKQEAQQPGANEDSRDSGSTGGERSESGSGGDSGSAASGEKQQTSGGDAARRPTGSEGSADAESPPDSKISPVTGKSEQSGDQADELSSPGSSSQSDSPQSGADSAARETGTESRKDTAPQSKATEQPARTAEASPKAPAPKSEETRSASPKPDVPEKAAEPKKPEGAAKQEESTGPEPAKSGPAPQPPRSGGRGAAGGAGAKPAGKGDEGKKGQPPPNLAGVAPEAGLRQASRLKPHQALHAMNGVDSAVDRDVGDEHQKLSSDPPAMQRPSGAPRTLEGKPKADAPAQYSDTPAKKADEPEKKNAEVKDQKKPEGELEAENVEEPSGWDTLLMGLGYLVGEIGSWFDSDVKPEDLAATFAGMPTEDDAMKEAKAGSAPGVQMQGKADQKSRDQDENVDEKGNEAQRTARDDSQRRMGEDQVYPNAPDEKLNGKVPGPQQAKGGGPAGSAGTGAVPEDAASEVAEHERGKEFRSSFGKGEQGLADAKKQKDKDTRDSKDEHRRSVDREVRKNSEQQGSKRQQTVGDVSGERQRWRSEQDAELNKLGSKKSDKRRKAEQDVDKHERDTDDKAEKRKKDDNDKIRQKGEDAQSEAKSKRDDTKKQAGNWVEKAFEWIKQKFIELRDKIISILQAARDAVVEFIDNFKLDIEELINSIRETIVNLIKTLIDDLIELAKAMLRAIVELANEIRRFITELIEQAIALVTKLAEQLKQLVNDLLDAIAKLLSDILNALKKAMDAAIKAVKDAVKAVLDFASKLLSGLGEFMMVAVDFLRDPGGWLAGAKGSAENGAKHHFFREVKSAVKTWFQQKIEEIVGVPKAVINKLIEGGLTLGWIVQQVWNAVVPQLPLILGELIITKVVAKLIPGAGWVMAVIDAIKTAIGALGEILRAFGAVLEWLKNVRKGGAGVLFAKAVAAGVVALLELAYEFLLSGIGKYVGKVGDRLKGIAKNIGKKGRRKQKDGQGGDDENSRNRPGRRTDQTRPRNTRTGEGTSGDERAHADLRNPRRGTDDRRNDSRENRNEADRQREDDRVSPNSAARQAANKPGKPGPDRDAPKPDRNQRGRTESDQDRRRREDNDRDRPDKDPKDRDQRQDKDNPDSRDRKPTDRDDSPSANDKDGNPKGKKDEDKPDTKPTPSAKPKADPPRKPREDTDTKKDQKKDDDKQKPKDDDTGTKKHDDKDTNREDDNSDSNRRRDDGSQRKDDDPNRKKDEDGPDKRKDSDSNDKKSKSRTNKDDGNPGRPKSKPAKDKTRKDEKKKKDDSLQAKLRRIHRHLEPKLDRGIPEPTHLELLEEFRRFYRLTRLWKKGGDSFRIWGKGSPEKPGPTRGVHTDENEDKTKKDKLPATIYPNSSDGRRAPSKSKVQYLHSPIRPGQDANDAEPGNPLGWRREMHDWPDVIVRMHLITETMGGTAHGSNLVPAPSRTNSRFDAKVERKAVAAAKKSDESMTWYKVQVQFHSAPWQNFPSRITGTWGRYKKSGDSWTEKAAKGGATYSEPVYTPRVPDEDWQVRANDPFESKTRFKRAFGLKRPMGEHKSRTLDRVVKNIIKTAKKGDAQTAEKLIEKLEEMEKRSRSKYKDADLFREIKEGIRQADLKDLIDFNPQIKQ